MQKYINLIIENNLSELKTLINPLNINLLDDKHNTLLHYAIYYKKYEISYFLIENKIDINIRNIDGYTPLLLAVRNDMFDLVIKLLNNNCNRELKNNNHEDYIFLAFKYGRNKLIQYFYNLNLFNLNNKNINGETLIHALIYSSNLEIFKEIYKKEYYFLTDIYNNTLLMLAYKLRAYDICNYIINYDNTVVNYNNKYFNKLIKNNLDFKALTIILKAGFILDDYNYILIKNNYDIELYDKKIYYKDSYKLIYYFFLDDYDKFRDNINLHNIYLKDIFNHNIVYYLKLYYSNYKNNRYYKALINFTHKVL